MSDPIRTAQIETRLMVEHLAPPGVRPELEECVWVGDVPLGPSAEGIRQLQAFQARYGFSQVTTGNAGGTGREPPKGTGQICGVYVHRSAVRTRKPDYRSARPGKAPGALPRKVR